MEHALAYPSHSLQICGSPEVINSTIILGNVVENKLGKAGSPHPTNPILAAQPRKKHEVHLPWHSQLGQCQQGPHGQLEQCQQGPHGQLGQCQQGPHGQLEQCQQGAHGQLGQCQQGPHGQLGQCQQGPHGQLGQCQQGPHGQLGQCQQGPHAIGLKSDIPSSK